MGQREKANNALTFSKCYTGNNLLRFKNPYRKSLENTLSNSSSDQTSKTAKSNVANNHGNSKTS